MSESVLPQAEDSRTSTGRLRRVRSKQLLSRVFWMYLALSFVVTAVGLVVGVLSINSGMPFDADLGLYLTIGAGSGVLLLGGALLFAWRKKQSQAGLMMVLWALAVLTLGSWLFPLDRITWVVMVLLPVLYAVLFLPWIASAVTTAIGLALVWGINLWVLPIPSSSTQWTMIILSAIVGAIAALFASISAVLDIHQQQLVGSQAAFADLEQYIGDQQTHFEAASQQLAQEQERINALLDVVDDGIVLTNTAGAIVSANAHVRRMLGETQDHVLEGRQIQEWTDPDSATVRVLSAERDGTRLNVTFKEPSNTEGVVHLTQAPIRTSAGEQIGFIGLFRDQTRAVHQEQLQSQFLAFLMQDIQDPLNSVLSAQDTLLATDLGSGNERVLTTARRTTSRLLDRVQMLLEINNIQEHPDALHILNHPLRPLIESCVAQMTPIAQQRSINVVVEYLNDGGPLPFDSDRMRRMLVNLLEYVLGQNPAYSTVRVQLNYTNKAAQLRIVDQGAGLTPDQAEHIFDRFGVASGDQRLGGLGLAFCKVVIEAHGGRIWAESTPGKGSTYTWSLPLGA